MKECKHQNIVITTKNHYHIPEGWEKLQEKDDIDMEDYRLNTFESSIFCEDCGEYLE